MRYLILIPLLCSLALAQGPGGKAGLGGNAGFGGGASAGGGAPSTVGGCAHSDFSTTTSACAVNLTGTLNDWIVVYGFGSGTLSVQIAAGGTCVVASWSNSTQASSIQQFWGKITTGGGTCKPQVNATVSGSMMLAAGEITGASAVDVTGGITGAFTNSITCPSVTTTASNDLVVCGILDSGASIGTFTPTGGATNLITQPAAFGATIESQTKAVAGAIAPTATYSVTSAVGSGTIAFKP